MISPLVSLIVDQVCSLQTRGICAAILSGNREQSAAGYLLELPEVTVIVDEAHCVYKIMCPHTLSAHSLHERLHHCHIFTAYYTKNKW